VTFGSDPYGVVPYSILPTGAGGPAQQISPASIATAQAVGVAALSFTLSLSGIGPAEAVGAAQVVAVAQPAAVQSGAAVGSPSVQYTVSPAGIPTGEMHGAASVPADAFAYATGVAAVAAIGQVTFAVADEDSRGFYQPLKPITVRKRRRVDAAAVVDGVAAVSAVGPVRGIASADALVAGVAGDARVGAVAVEVGPDEDEELMILLMLGALDEVV